MITDSLEHMQQKHAPSFKAHDIGAWLAHALGSVEVAVCKV